MLSSSAKSKGRLLQKLLVAKILENFSTLKPDDVTSRSMGAGGEDLLLSPKARELLPYSFECKNTESVNVWKAYQQAVDNSKEYEPILVIKKNHKEPLAVVDLDFLLDLVKVKEYNV